MIMDELMTGRSRDCFLESADLVHPRIRVFTVPDDLQVSARFFCIIQALIRRFKVRTGKRFALSWFLAKYILKVSLMHSSTFRRLPHEDRTFPNPRFHSLSHNLHLRKYSDADSVFGISKESPMLSTHIKSL